MLAGEKAVMSISYHDVERLQAFFPEHKIELRDGKLIIMSPSDFMTGVIGAQFITLLNLWVIEHGLGRVFGASVGFLMTNEDLLSPKVSFVSRDRLKQSPRTYVVVIPELVVEIKSSTDRIRELEQKIALFLTPGSSG
jgi:Uma2 family endonuclease